MAKKYATRVMQTSTTPGTGPFSFNGTVTGFASFAGPMSSGDTCDYAAFDVDTNGNPTGPWEAGIGTLNSDGTLGRTTVQESSNAGGVVNFAAGTRRIMMGLTGASLMAIIASIGTGGGGGGSDVNGKHRYWQLTNMIAQSGASQAVCFAELVLAAKPGAAAQPVQVITASSTYSNDQNGYGAANLIDANNNTIWSGEAGQNPQTLTLDMGTPVGVGEVRMTSRPDSTYYVMAPTSYTIRYSDDGTTWSNGGNIQMPQFTGASQVQAAQIGNGGSSLANTVPAGGTTGQVLAKKSGADFDTQWVAAASGGGGGGAGSFLGSTALTLPADTDIATGAWQTPGWTADHDPLGTYAGGTITAPPGATFAKITLKANWSNGGSQRACRFSPGGGDGGILYYDVRGGAYETASVGTVFTPVVAGTAYKFSFNSFTSDANLIGLGGSYGGPSRAYIEWFSDYPAPASGGSGGGVQLHQITDQTAWGNDTSSTGVPVPGSAFNVVVPADGYYLVRHNIRYVGGHRVRFNVTVDGAVPSPSNAENSGFDHVSYGDSPGGSIYLVQADTIVHLTAGAHTIGTLYNAMDSTNGVTTVAGHSYVSVTPVTAS